MKKRLTIYTTDNSFGNQYFQLKGMVEDYIDITKYCRKHIDIKLERCMGEEYIKEPITPVSFIIRTEKIAKKSYGETNIYTWSFIEKAIKYPVEMGELPNEAVIFNNGNQYCINKAYFDVFIKYYPDCYFCLCKVRRKYFYERRKLKKKDYDPRFILAEYENNIVGMANIIQMPEEIPYGKIKYINDFSSVIKYRYAE